MDAHFQLISDGDLARTIGLMREFYESTQMRFDEEVARAAMRKTLLDPGLGSVYLVLVEKEVVGYFVLTFCFSLEFHGRFALLDELYVREPFRHRGLGKAVMAFAENSCRQAGVKALRLEVANDNHTAQALYTASGLQKDSRFLFTKWL